MEIQKLYKIFRSCGSVVTDTRKITPGSLFFALKGDRFDANTFAAEALEKGAGAVVIDNPQYAVDHRTIVVNDSLEALQKLASFHREQLGIPIIGLTGSNGKTTTKELMHAVLSKRFRAGATVGNVNNHIGVPLTLLSFTTETEIGIVEMGANHQKEIAFLCGIAKPDYGYITNFGKAHLEGFGGVEGVIKGKSEMYDFLFSHDKTAFINLDDALQTSRSENHKRVTFGFNRTDADVNITAIEADPFVTITFDGGTIHSKLIGRYNANNIALAVAVGVHFGVPDADIIAALEAYTPENNRSQLMEKGGNRIILDAYNANPSSMAAALENFQKLEAAHKVAFLGDMFELGPESAAEHAAVSDLAAGVRADAIYLVGKDFSANRNPAPHLRYFESFEALADFLPHNRPQNSTILIKGSRGMALERILDLL